MSRSISEIGKLAEKRELKITWFVFLFAYLVSYKAEQSLQNIDRSFKRWCKMNSKGFFYKLILTVCSGLILISCATILSTSIIKGQNWLDSKKSDKPNVNMTGTWIAQEWGMAIFRQEGEQLTGSLGDYPVKGVVSGNSVYLMMYYKNEAHYFAELKGVDQDTFEGNYSKYETIDEVRKREESNKTLARRNMNSETTSLKPIKLKRIF